MADVGIVMPVYTQDSRLFRIAIRSVLNQRYRNFKLIIVIDGVTRNVLRIARYYARKDSRISVIPRQKNRGTAFALNLGFSILQKRSKIKYLTWVSSDNYYYPNFVGTLRRRLKKSPRNVGLAYGSFRFINGKGKPLNIPWTNNLKDFQDQPKEKLVDYYFIGYSFLYKKKFARKIAGYKYTPVEDYDYFLRLTEHCDITYVDKILVDFRLESPHSNSLQIATSGEKHRRRRYLMYEVMQQARQRRNIRPELTIIFPISEPSPQSIHSLGMLLDQSYSNYKVLIYDVSSTQDILPVINQNPDPRIQYFWLPGGTTQDVISQGLKFADTPLVMFYRTGTDFDFHHSVHLAEMISQHGIVAFRYDTLYSQGINSTDNPLASQAEEPLFRQIYRTDQIKSVLTY